MNNRFESEKVGSPGTEPEVGPGIPLFTLEPGWSRFFLASDRKRVMKPSRVQLLGLCILATFLFAYLALRIWLWS